MKGYHFVFYKGITLHVYFGGEILFVGKKIIIIKNHFSK